MLKKDDVYRIKETYFKKGKKKLYTLNIFSWKVKKYNQSNLSQS